MASPEGYKSLDKSPDGGGAEAPSIAMPIANASHQMSQLLEGIGLAEVRKNCTITFNHCVTFLVVQEYRGARDFNRLAKEGKIKLGRVLCMVRSLDHHALKEEKASFPGGPLGAMARVFLSQDIKRKSHKYFEDKGQPKRWDLFLGIVVNLLLPFLLFLVVAVALTVVVVAAAAAVVFAAVLPQFLLLIFCCCCCPFYQSRCCCACRYRCW